VTLALMCGLSFAGKSTFAALLAEELGAELVSLDAINAERGLDGGQGIPLTEWAESNRIAHARAKTILRENSHVVVDDTGSPRFIRDSWRETALAADVPFRIVWVQIDLELQRARVEANRADLARHDVVEGVLTDHIAAFEPPLDEDPVVVDATDTRDLRRVREVAEVLSCRTR
jgi:predicted kinase